jgi:AAHS family cis,cis-muconate transporter-like MFS transporter
VSELNFDFTQMTGFLAGTYVAMIVGKVAAGYLADIVGRRWMFVFGGLSTAAFLPVIVLLHSPENIIVLLTIFGFLYGVPYGVNATYMTESFDTHVRGTAVGIVPALFIPEKMYDPQQSRTPHTARSAAAG